MDILKNIFEDNNIGFNFPMLLEHRYKKYILLGLSTHKGIILKDDSNTFEVGSIIEILDDLSREDIFNILDINVEVVITNKLFKKDI